MGQILDVENVAAPGGVVLYDGSPSGDTGEITLNDNVLNYSYVDLMFGTNSEWAMQRVPREWIAANMGTSANTIKQYVAAGSSGQITWPPTYNSIGSVRFNSETEVYQSTMYHNTNYKCKIRKIVGYV